MNAPVADDYIVEIRGNIARGDVIKAQLVLEELDELERSDQARVLAELHSAPADFAVPFLAELTAQRSDLILAYPALRQTLVAKMRLAPEAALPLLSLWNRRPSRVVVVELVGEARLSEAVGALVELLNGETDEDLLEAALRSLGRIGDPEALSVLGEYLYAENQDLIHTAAVALASLGTPGAVSRLADRLGRDMHLDLLILDLLAQISSPASLDKLARTLAASQAYLRVTAKKKLAEIGVLAVPFLVVNLDSTNSDLVIHSLNVLGEIGDASAVPPIRQLLHREPPNANVRFAAYEALGLLPLQKQAYALAPGLLDPVENVRSAAASAIDRSFNPTLRTGLANMLSIHVKEAPDIIQAVIDAQCGRVFMGLVDDPAFGDAAFRYLGNSAHPDVREYFLRVIEERGRVDLIDRLAVRPKPPEEQRVRVMAVDDSKMILKIMRGMLHKLGCEALLYEFPSVALQELQAQKPDLLFTDLNMPDITGIDLTRQVRRSFGPDVLPIVMVTTQQEETDHQTAYQAGVDYILPKPFTEEQLDQVIRRFARRTQKAAA